MTRNCTTNTVFAGVYREQEHMYEGVAIPDTESDDPGLPASQ